MSEQTDEKRGVYVRFEPQEHVRLAEMAQEADRPISYMIRKIVRDYLRLREPK